MKRLITLTFGIVLATGVCSFKSEPEYRRARREGAMAEIRVHVVDENGSSVSNANVQVFMGMNFRPRGYYVRGTTDKDGVFTAKGKTCGDEVVIDVTKPGCYSSSRRLCFATMGAEGNVVDGRWQPQVRQEQIELRSICCPLKQEAEGDFVPTARLNVWIGYDLERHDFVAPDGSGQVADLEVRINWDGNRLQNYRGMGVDVRFTKAYSGRVEYASHADSSFSGPYAADAIAQYDQSQVSFYERVLDDQTRVRCHWDKGKQWIVRSRCEVDVEGKLIRAHYSVVDEIRYSGERDGRASIRIISLFNPTPNDINLEPMSYEAKKWLRAQKKGLVR
jgi:hypothetical protein